MAVLAVITQWNRATVSLAHTQFSLLHILGLMCIGYVFFKAIYNVFFHPLRRFPGPVANRLTNIPYCISVLWGAQPYYILSLHERYGPVVRVSPNELSFTSSESWKDIYGSGYPASAGLPKASFYDGFVIGLTSILTERNISKHHTMRSQLAPAFSDRALNAQEPLIASIIDKWVDRIGAYADQPVDLVKWFNIVAFEVMGELAFGTSFGGLDKGEMHPWVANVQNSLRAGFLVDIVNRSLLMGGFLILRYAIWLVKLVQGVMYNQRYTSEIVDRRLERGLDRDDFLSAITKSGEKIGQDVSIEQLKAHWSDVINAGTDTTATPLIASIWYIKNNPRIWGAVRNETRTAFSDYSQIDRASTSKLKWLPAIVSEALRMYHPLPLGLPRMCSKGGATVAGYSVPENTVVSTHPFAASMTKANFSDPWQFRPERWFKETCNDNPTPVVEKADVNKDDLAAVKPFLTGSRSCLGRSFALLEIRTILAKMIYRYDIELVEGRCSKDWHGDSKAYLFWTKPDLVVNLSERQ